MFDFRLHKKVALGSSTSQSKSWTSNLREMARLVAIVVFPVFGCVIHGSIFTFRADLIGTHKIAKVF